MVAIPRAITNPIVEAMDAWRAEQQGLPFREHLGASIIGRECAREIWYSWRWATNKRHEGRIIRLFTRGEDEEAKFTEELRGIGCEVFDRDPDNPEEQIRFSSHGDHFGGSCDAILRGLPGAEKTWHIGEYKTHNDKSFRALLKDGVEKSKPEHYAQMQVYMLKHGLKRAVYLARNKNDDSTYAERVKLDRAVAAGLDDKAYAILSSRNPPPRMSEDPAFFKCKFCDHNDTCHHGSAPWVSCRTCIFAKPELDGQDAQWWCRQHERPLDKDAQLKACEHHTYPNSLLKGIGDPVEPGRPLYQTGKALWGNGVEASMEPGNEATAEPLRVYTSQELQAMGRDAAGIIQDELLNEVRDTFGGTIESLGGEHG